MILILLCIAGIAVRGDLSTGQKWVAQSDAHTQFLLNKIGQFAPRETIARSKTGLEKV